MKYKILLFVFCIALSTAVATIFTYRYYTSSKPEYSHHELESIIQDGIFKALDKSDTEVQTVINYLNESDQLRFIHLPPDHGTPYYIFFDKQLVYWSDYKFVPKYENLSGNYAYRLTQFRIGKSIVCRNAFIKAGQHVEIFYCIPLSKKYSIENKYIFSEVNSEIFGGYQVSIQPEASTNSARIKDRDGKYLFSVTLNENELPQNSNVMYLILCFGIISLVGFVFCFVKLINIIIEQKQVEWAILIVAIFLAGIRVAMLTTSFPYLLFEWGLFDPRYFASSSISPSLGDLFLNTLCATIFFLFVFVVYSRSRLYKNKLIKFRWAFLLAFAAIVLYYGAFQIFYNTLITINLHSKWPIDINYSLDFNEFRLVALSIFVLTVINIFFCSHILSRTFIYFSNRSIVTVVQYMLLAGALVAMAQFYIDEVSLVVLVVSGANFLFILIFKFPRHIQSIRYLTYVYLLSTAAVCSMIGAYSFYVVNLDKTSIEKSKFASQVLIESDVLGEYLLSEAQQNIESDEFIKSRFVTLFSGKEFIEQKIKKVFLPNYFEKYDVQISLYDAIGNAYNPSEEYITYGQAAKVLGQPSNVTDYRNVYYIDDLTKSGLRKYVVFNKILKNKNIIGFILIQLTNKKIIPNSVYPELLVDRKFEQTSQGKNFSYAIYSGKNLISSYGAVNYENELHPSILTDQEIFSEGVVTKNFHHLAIKGVENRIIVVSSLRYTIQNIFSNFTFLFFIYLVVILLILIVPAIYSIVARVHSSFSTKIQIYLNIAFFLPLVIVCVTTLSVISNSYQENLNHSFVQKAEGISNNISRYFSENLNSSVSLENSIRQMAQYTECDINYYGTDGLLKLTSQPMIFRQGLLSSYINSKAFAEITEKNAHAVLLSESVGTLNYNCVYVAVKSFESGKLIGIASVPFFESRLEIEKQLIDVLTIIINIFISVFLLFVFLSYFASRILTVPLTIITNKIKRTTLGGKNEPLHWEVKDEIGLMVGEYNKMLINLEASKIALSTSEKESAWREMAKQIAHEIKNPLTPMKLTLQHLQRTIKYHETAINEKVETVIVTLLTQINHLSEIATSFSAFAKMPLPKDEVVDIVSVVNSVVVLYNNADANISLRCEHLNLFVKGDNQTFIGIFSNLIINGIQAVPAERHPTVVINIEANVSDVTISITDNGIGIPNQYKSKIFVPNFSTKFSGSGIGLALAKRNVEHLGGKVWYESVDNEGTTFIIQIPLM